VAADLFACAMSSENVHAACFGWTAGAGFLLLATVLLA